MSGSTKARVISRSARSRRIAAASRSVGVQAACAVWLLAACTFKERPDSHSCTVDKECAVGQMCDRGFCVTKNDETVRSPATGAKDSAAAAPESSDASSGLDPQPSAASDASASADAQTPAEAVCESGASRSCTLEGASAERCRIGVQLCENGTFGMCAATPRPETCDGIDEDCDGKVDEAIAVDCYPAGMLGCTLSANTPPECKGRCALGQQTCVDGKLSACTGAITPATEACTATGASIDEDCDGMTDEICTCNQGETRACYPAASSTLNVGKCKAGTQSCSNGMLGTCTDAVMPTTETCANEGADDNCDGIADNILNRGVVCTVASNMGICKNGTLQCRGTELTCVTTPAAAAESCNGTDDDCDGKLDEGFNLQADTANCGACGTSCAAGNSCCAGKCVNLQEDENSCGACGAPTCARGSTCCKGMCVDTMQDGTSCGACGTTCMSGQTCCGGQCVDTKNDPKHCGTCTNACSMGAQPGCCDGSCVDFLSQQNCGRCGQVCGVLDAGVACTCATTASGTMCMSSALGVCL